MNDLADCYSHSGKSIDNYKFHLSRFNDAKIQNFRNGKQIND